MRALLLLPVLLSACVGFQPLPKSKRPVAAEASAKATLPEWRTIGTSVQGRALRTREFGRGPRRVLWVGGIHGDERVGVQTNAQLPEAFLATPGAADRVTLTFLEDVNPDGTAAGTRRNANDVDLNRNYPARNFVASDGNGQRPLDQPEAKALHDLIRALDPQLVVVVHAWRGDHFINFDGPADRLAASFSERSGYRVKASDKIAPTPGSLGSWVGRTLGIPILTLEYERGTDPETAWRDTRAAILGVILGE